MMKIKNKKILTGLLGLVSAGTLIIGTAQADTRTSSSGYQTDSAGDIVRDSAGNCVHSDSWTKADATVVGCDGVTLNAPVKVVSGKGTGVFAGISMTATSMFEFDKADLNDEGKATIEEYRKQLGPELTDAYLVVIVGHTDSSGDPAHNQALSLKRAQSVADYLVSTGVSADKLRVIGRGAKDPLVSNETREGRIQNRRVDILAVAEVRALDTMEIPSAALFERRSGDLTAEGKSLLDKNLTDARELFSRASYVEIVGHTDDVGDDAYNMALSVQRAESVRDYLVSKGLDDSKVVITGMGETMPIASNNTEEGRAQNRRVEILMLGRMKE
jgi:OOP family OmpA-OmpF porin